MIKYILSNKNKIEVHKKEILENNYHGTQYKTLKINNQYILKQRDKVGFQCDNCGDFYEILFHKGNKFLKEEILCKTCSTKNTKHIEYGDKNYNNSKKTKITCLSRYGVENPSQLDKIKTKKKMTCIDNYGVESPFKSEKIKAIYKKNSLKKYGVEWPIQFNIVRNKIKNTNIEKYGVENPMQDLTIMKKQQLACGGNYSLKKIRDNLHYQTKLELKYINKCISEKIYIFDGPKIPYIWNNKIHYYYIDFETKDNIIEIKGKHMWYYEDLASGKIDAKNKAAEEYAETIGKEFLFLLEDYMLGQVTDFEKKVEKSWDTEAG